MTVRPATGSGAPSRLIASHEIAPTVMEQEHRVEQRGKIDEPRRP